MTDGGAGASLEGLIWAAIGVIGGVVFYSRFYVQWIVSEIKGRSVVPMAFWYQSCFGSIFLLLYAIHAQSPLGALSQSLNIIPYTRNLIHLWRERGALTRRLNIVANGLAVAIALGAVMVVAFIWLKEYERTQSDPAGAAQQTWFWLAVGVAGQALFGSRFLIQWMVTEIKKKSTVPTIFWYISIMAALLQFVSFASRGGGEWLYAAGLIATMFIYFRNIWLIHRGRTDVLPDTVKD